MIEISNRDRDIIIRYIEETYNERRPQGLRESNLQRMAHQVAKRLKSKKIIEQK